MANETVNPETELAEPQAPPTPAPLDDSAFWTTGPEGELVPNYDATFPTINEGEVVQPDQRRPFRSQIVDRDGDVAVAQLSGGGPHQIEIVQDVGGADLDDEPVDPLI